MEVLFDPHPIPPSDEGGRVKKGEKNENRKRNEARRTCCDRYWCDDCLHCIDSGCGSSGNVIIQTAEKLQQNAQASGDDTQEQMSTKVILLSTVIDDMTGGAEELFSTLRVGAQVQNRFKVMT